MLHWNSTSSGRLKGESELSDYCGDVIVKHGLVYTGGKETTMFSIIQAFMIYGMIIVGDPMAATGHYGVSCVGKPDEKTIEWGRLLGKRVAELALKVVK